MSGPKFPRLMTAKQVQACFGIPLAVVYTLRNQGRLATEWKNGAEKILRESVYEFLDSLKNRDNE